MIALSNLRTGSRLVGSFLLVSILVITVSVVGYTGMGTLSTGLTAMYDEQLVPVSDMIGIQVDLYTIRGDVYKFMLAPEGREAVRATIADREALVDARLGRLRTTALDAEEAALLQQFDTAWQAYRVAVEDILADVVTDGDEAISAALSADHPAVIARQALDSAVNQLVSLNLAHAEAAHLGGEATFSGASRTMVIVGGLSVALAIGLGVVISRSITVPLAILVAMANSLAVGDLLRRQSESVKASLQRRRDEVGDIGRAFEGAVAYLQEAGAAATAVAGGDLEATLPVRGQHDELGLAISGMIESLRAICGRVQGGSMRAAEAAGRASEASTQAGIATGQVAATTEQVAEGATQTSTSVNDAGRALDDLVQAIEGIARGAQDAAGAVGVLSDTAGEVETDAGAVKRGAATARAEAEGGRAAAIEGTSAVRATLAGMEEIQRVVLEATVKVQEMGQRSREVSRIVATIDDIAAQTNLLALNAQIEAARAGDQGRGFAVVADEVRKLAERSARATKEIDELVRTVQDGAQGAVDAIGRGGTEVTRGVDLARQAGEVISGLEQTTARIEAQARGVEDAGTRLTEVSRRMLGEVERVSSVVEEVSASTEEMAASSNQVREALGSVASIAQEVSASAEEVAAATEEVAAQAQEVQALASEVSEQCTGVTEAVAFFRLGAAQSVVAPAAPLPRTIHPATASVPRAVAVVHGDGGNGNGSGNRNGHG
ncbi:MAG: methyl-accepting chemotaxis protein [Anaerolineae bacterium]